MGGVFFSCMLYIILKYSTWVPNQNQVEQAVKHSSIYISIGWIQWTSVWKCEGILFGWKLSSRQVDWTWTYVSLIYQDELNYKNGSYRATATPVCAHRAIKEYHGEPMEYMACMMYIMYCMDGVEGHPSGGVAPLF
jgi:hypothetical protein